MKRYLHLSLTLICATIGGCELAETPATSGADVCDEPLVHVSLPDEIEESSGVAASRSHDGVFWTHNDSGGGATLFAVDSTGAVLARVQLDGVTNRDWEDIAVGPCGEDGGSCVFLADIGDNNERHDRIAVYRVREPDPRGDTKSAGAYPIRARYPEGPRDAEALFVTEAGIHIVNKGRSDAIELFRLPPPYDSARVTELQRVQQVAPPPTSVSAQITAAGVSPDGQQVVLRSYAGLRFFRVAGDTLASWGRNADLVAPEQMQGEGVDWLEDGRLVLTSERQGPTPPFLALLRCDPSRPRPDSGD